MCNYFIQIFKFFIFVPVELGFQFSVSIAEIFKINVMLILCCYLIKIFCLYHVINIYSGLSLCDSSVTIFMVNFGRKELKLTFCSIDITCLSDPSFHLYFIPLWSVFFNLYNKVQ